MKLHFTPEQAAQIEPLMLRGRVLLGRVVREEFDGSNAGTAGRLMLELGTVAEASLPKLREAIRREKGTPP